MDAAKNGKIFYLDSSNWYTVSGGVHSTQSMLSEMETALGISEK
jgi:iron complex transport system substrate-binding protein